jgi:hypothetical protein
MPENARECPNPSEHHEHSDDNLPPSQLLAIEALILGGTLAEVANAAGVDPKTLYRWRHHDPRFQQRLARRRHELLDGAADRFRTLLDGAMTTLQKQMTDPYAPTAFRAARAVVALAHLDRPSNPDQPNRANQAAAECGLPTDPDLQTARTA